MRLLLLLVLALVSVPRTASAEGVPLGRWRVDLGVLAGGDHAVPRPNIDLVLSARARQPLTPEMASLQVRFLLRGRTRLDLLRQGQPFGTRVTTLGVELERGKLTVRLGRHPLGQSWRVVDGAQVLGAVQYGVRIGGWVGLLPDSWSTRPSADRLGAGPLVRLTLPRIQASLTGEVALALGGPVLTAPGPVAVDRAGVRVAVSGQPVDPLRLDGQLDLQVRPTGPPGIADAGAHALWRFAPSWDLRGGWSMWSSIAHRVTRDRDARLRTFGDRLDAALGTVTPTLDVLDTTHHHAIVLRVRRRPGAQPVGLELETRYRHAADPADRWVRSGVRVGGYGLGVLDLEATTAFVWSDGRPRLVGGPRVWITPVDPLSIEVAFLGTADLSATSDAAHAAVVEAFAMIRPARSLLLSIGYELEVSRDALGATPFVGARHQAFLRVGLRTP